MNYFIFGYVETVLTENVRVSNVLPVAIKGDSQPAAASSGAAVSGTLYWNALDTVNGNSYVYAATKIAIISNTDGSNSCTVTIATPGDTINGLARTVADFAIVVPAGDIGIIPRLPASFADEGLIKLVTTGTGAAETFIAVLNIV